MAPVPTNTPFIPYYSLFKKVATEFLDLEDSNLKLALVRSGSTCTNLSLESISQVTRLAPARNPGYPSDGVDVTGVTWEPYSFSGEDRYRLISNPIVIPITGSRLNQVTYGLLYNYGTGDLVAYTKFYNSSTAIEVGEQLTLTPDSTHGFLYAFVEGNQVITSPPTPYNEFLERFGKGQFNFSPSNPFKVALYFDTSNFDDFGLVYYPEITDELPNENGYYTGGQAVTEVTFTETSGGEFAYDFAPLRWKISGEGFEKIVGAVLYQVSDGLLVWGETLSKRGVDVFAGEILELHIEEAALKILRNDTPP